jgi:transposase
MDIPEKAESEHVSSQYIRSKLTERDCPRCDAILLHNDNEQCYECLNCGYIDCGDDVD